MSKLIITPKTRIADLLDDYPELEDVLIKTAPQFKKLKNPVLRKTIARITNISQAATIGNLKTEELVNILRKAVGQDDIESFDDMKGRYNTQRPGWYSEANIAGTIDIRDMLNAGEQPVHEVLSRLKQVKEDEILAIIAPFVPAPLIDKATSLSYDHWLQKLSDEEYRVYLVRAEEGGK
ncbi:MAG TPA: DUF1858 domain-containing protein [Bacteroidales bacterium]|nr:DUF1858 domain-containing protein [Bacteroidales bacterium]